mmetsp:Transcript_20537/g.36931  ORF Transcript_20537/g.36931 Transcript_20537/m.36931 type:complete len:80 (+) Transcript_20537:117-356(+)
MSSGPLLYLFFFPFRGRLSWSKWQNWQEYPFAQRPFGWKQQRLHCPDKWAYEPMDGTPSTPATGTDGLLTADVAIGSKW